MKTLDKTYLNIQGQYDSPGLFEEISKRLIEQNIDAGSVTRTDVSGVDEFHVRGAQVSKELTSSIELHGLKVLDVGCGLGGPARMLADEFQCTVTGIDMSRDYIRTAEKLSTLLGLSDRTKFLQGDALALPFEDGSFDIVWTQHVQMNVEDKTKFYTEIHRVLSPSGKLVYYDIFGKGNGDVNYPVPWANSSAVSFLNTTENMEAILQGLRFSRLTSTDQTEKATEFLDALFEKIKANGPPKLGLNVLMGASTKEKLGNIRKGISDDAIELQSGVYIK